MRLLVLGHNDWWVWRRQGFCTRNAALVRELARRPSVEAVAVVDTPRFRGRTHRPTAHRGDDLTPVAEKTVAVRWSYPLPLPSRRTAGRRLNEALSWPGLRRRLGRWRGVAPLVVLVGDPRLMSVAVRLSGDLIVMDVIDDWRYHAWAGRVAVEEGYALADRHADLVTGVSRAALEQVGLGQGHVLRNGLQWAAFRDLAPSADAPPGLRRPVVGYVGVLQERFDSGLLCDVARLLPEVTFVLAGPLLHGLPAELSRPPKNVRLVGPIERPLVPGWLAALDAAIVPHRRDGLTASMDPLKLYEYLAAGRPVVSTVASPNPALRPFVRVAVDANGFAAALTDELAGDGRERRTARRRAMEPLDWSARADELLELIGRSLAARSGHTAPPRAASVSEARG